MGLANLAMQMVQVFTTVPSNVAQWHSLLCWVMIVSGVATFITLFFISAPYGRHSRAGWGILLTDRFAWLTQEIPSLLVTAAICWSSGLETFTTHPTSLRTVAAGLFLAHYTYRSLVYPTTMRAGKRMPLGIWLMSVVFCIWNGFLQGYMLGYQLPHSKPVDALAAVGFAVQLLGLLNVIYADRILVTLRKPGESGYKIPYGGMFKLVSAGNYASEIIEWTGYALATRTLAGTAFAMFVFCNLAPRGVSHHEWYLQKFADTYPRNRKAVLPFLW